MPIQIRAVAGTSWPEARPVAKLLICKFVAKAAFVPDAAPSDDAVVANNVEDPPPAAVIDPAPLPVHVEVALLPLLPQALKKPLVCFGAPLQKERAGALQGQEGLRLTETFLILHKCD